MKTTTVRSLAVLFLLVANSAALRAADEVQVVADVVYGHKDGMALTFDVIKPVKPNGAALLWIQSGGWYSNWVEPKGWPGIVKPYLDKGITVFIVRHGSAPKYAVPDAVDDVRRSVRFIRLKAKDFNVDPERLCATGGSAGGHLALMLATAADEGDANSKDEVLKQSDRVACVVALYPPTDIRNWTTDPPEAIKKIPQLKPPLTFDEKKTPDLSPLLKVSDKTAPSLLIHGDKDELVPIEHSRKMLEAMQKAKAPVKLLVIEGAGHGFSKMQNEDIVLPAMLEWLEKYTAKRAD